MAPRIWIGYPVRVRDAVATNTHYALYPLGPRSWENIRTTSVVGHHAVSLTALFPLEFQGNNPHAPLTPTRVDPLGNAAVVLVGWPGGILEGPYEITSSSVSGASPVVSIEGELGARFDDDILEFVEVPRDVGVAPWVDLLATNPWRKWRETNSIDVVELMRSQAAAATTAAALRQALEEWGVTVAPSILTPDHRPLQGGERIVPGHIASPSGRYLAYDVGIQYVAVYPVRMPTAPDIARPRAFPLIDTSQNRWRETNNTLFINAGEHYAIGATLTRANGIDEELEVSTPDYFNKLGEYRDRRIVIEQEDVLGGARVLLSDGDMDTRAVYLDRAVLSQSGLASVVWDRTRWELQNTAVTTRVALYPENLAYIPNQIVTISGLADLGASEWRVTQVAHTFSGGDGLTELDLTAWQGTFYIGGGSGGDTE